MPTTVLPVPPLLRHFHTDEFHAPPWSRRDRRALLRVARVTEAAAPRLGLTAYAYVEHRCGTAATLRAIDAEAGGGFYVIPPDAETDAAAADDALGGNQVVIDIQTHLVRPTLVSGGAGAALMGWLRTVDPDRWGGRRRHFVAERRGVGSESVRAQRDRRRVVDVTAGTRA